MAQTLAVTPRQRHGHVDGQHLLVHPERVVQHAEAVAHVREEALAAHREVVARGDETALDEQVAAEAAHGREVRQVPVEIADVAIAQLDARQPPPAAEQLVDAVPAQGQRATQRQQLRPQANVADRRRPAQLARQDVPRGQLQQPLQAEVARQLRQLRAAVEHRQVVHQPSRPTECLPGVDEVVPIVVGKEHVRAESPARLTLLTRGDGVGGIQPAHRQAAADLAGQAVAVGLRSEQPPVDRLQSRLQGSRVTREEDELVAQIVLLLQRDRGGQRRAQAGHVEQRPEPAVDQPPALRAAVVGQWIVELLQGADRALEQTVPGVDLDRRQPGGQVQREPVAGAALRPRQIVGGAGAVHDADLDRLQQVGALARDVDVDVHAHRRQRRGTHGLQAVVHARHRSRQPLAPEPVHGRAERSGRGQAQRHPFTQDGPHHARQTLGPQQIEQLREHEPPTRRVVREPPHVVAHDVAILEVSEVARRGRHQGRVHQLIDGGDERQRAQQVTRELDLAELTQREDLGQVRRQEVGRQTHVRIRLDRPQRPIHDRREDGARQLQSVKLPQASQREDLEQVIRDQHHVAVDVDQLVAQRRFDQSDGSLPANQRRIEPLLGQEFQRLARHGQHQPRLILAHVRQDLVFGRRGAAVVVGEANRQAVRVDVVEAKRP